MRTMSFSDNQLPLQYGRPIRRKCETEYYGYDHMLNALTHIFHSTSTCIFKPGISPEVRRKLGEAAVRAAKAVNYVGAGETQEHWPTHIS